MLQREHVHHRTMWAVRSSEEKRKSKRNKDIKTKTSQSVKNTFSHRKTALKLYFLLEEKEKVKKTVIKNVLPEIYPKIFIHCTTLILIFQLLYHHYSNQFSSNYIHILWTMDNYKRDATSNPVVYCLCAIRMSSFFTKKNTY